MIKGIVLLVLFITLALLMGKLVSKIHLPAILGWLLTGMIIGPHALNWMDSSIIDAQWFHILSNIGEVFVGMLIGTELILKELKKSGKQILIICLFEGITSFIFVSVAFFIFADIPMPIALVFGAIALATAPAPSLSIVKEYNAQGPVSKTLIPLAALDDILALIVFFLVIGLVSGSMTGEGVNVFAILMMIVLPLALGAITGLIGAKVLKKECNKWQTILKVTALIILTVAIGVYINENILSINLVLSGISFAAFIANMVEEERLNEIMKDINPIMGIALVLVILDLGAPLDYNLIFGAGLLTAIYIISRGLGKIVGSYTGGKISKAEKMYANT